MGRLLVLSLVVLSFSFATYGQAYDSDYFKISNSRLELVSEEEAYQDELGADKGLAQIGQVIAIVDRLIAVGERVWKIVEKGRPVVSAQFQSTSVLPEVLRRDGSLHQMSGWSTPRRRKYRLVYENAYGIDVVTYEFSIQYQYGGSLDGKGAYLTGVKFIPHTVDVAWGYGFASSGEFISVTNQGSARNPLAGLTLQLNTITKTVFKESRRAMTFYVNGNGRLQVFE